MTRSKSSKKRRSCKASKLAEREDAATHSSASPSPPSQSSVSTLLSWISSPNPSSRKSTYLTSGHLPSAEYEHRKENDLCMYCGMPGHFYRSCEHPSSSASLRKATLES